MALATIRPCEIARRDAIKRAGKGLANGAGIQVKQLDFDGAVSVGVVIGDGNGRTVFKTPNPLAWAKWALKVYGRLCDDIEVGSEKPAWPFPISPDELHRRVVNQRRRIARERLIAAEKQARDVDAGLKTASKSKVFDCAIRPLIATEDQRKESVSFTRVIADLERIGI